MPGSVNGTAPSERGTAERGMAMIVGLGNPGDKYQHTRHNIGFDCLTVLREQMGNPSIGSKFESQMVRGVLSGRDVCLLWPMTFMNCSGRAVVQAARFYKVECENILVICDDLSLPLGKLRVRRTGSSGGQKGLGDILKSLGTQDVPRLRIGIDATPEHWETADYVLSKFSATERKVVGDALIRASQAVACCLSEGIESAMNRFNVAS